MNFNLSTNFEYLRERWTTSSSPTSVNDFLYFPLEKHYKKQFITIYSQVVYILWCVQETYTVMYSCGSNHVTVLRVCLRSISSDPTARSAVPSLSRFSTSEFFRREATFFLCRYHLLRLQDVAKCMPTKEKCLFARKNSTSGIFLCLF